MTDQTITKSNINVCFKCDKEATSFCRHCGQDFCEDHKSRYYRGLCSECIGNDNSRLEAEPLVDDEGVTRTGRRIRLIGEGWPAHMEMIRQLTDEGLEVKLKEWQSLLQESIRTTDYSRIMVCALEFEKEDRFKSKVRKLSKRREELKQGAVRLNGKKTRVKGEQKPKDPVEVLMGKMGVSREIAEKLWMALGGKK